MPEHTKVMGREWAQARRVAGVAQLAERLQSELAGHPTLTFELGCGHGHWLAAYSVAYPTEFCVGIDLITLRIQKSLRKQTKRELGNVLFMKAEATEFLDALPASTSLEKIFILYPDPWPKKKHHKNRFICPENLSRLAQRSTPGTQLHFRTDDADYFSWTVEHLRAHPQWELTAGQTWPFEQMTFFEERMKDKRDVFAVRVN